MGIAGTIGPQLFTMSYQNAPAGKVAPFIYSEVLFAAGFGALFFNEYPEDIFSYIGIGLIFTSGILITRNR